jgi:hypothetical protein
MPLYQYLDEAGRTVELMRPVAERDLVPPGLRRITVPVRVGIAGTSNDLKEPGSAEDAIPRAYREMEQTMPAREIVRESGFTIDQVKAAWNM